MSSGLLRQSLCPQSILKREAAKEAHQGLTRKIQLVLRKIKN
jgi:hypothetical protein